MYSYQTQQIIKILEIYIISAVSAYHNFDIKQRNPERGAILNFYEQKSKGYFIYLDQNTRHHTLSLHALLFDKPGDGTRGSNWDPVISGLLQLRELC